MIRTRTILYMVSCCLMSTAIRAQEKAYVNCDSQADPKVTVPVYTAPFSAWIIHSLDCGQQVSLLELDQGFAKIQIGKKIGYVKASYIRKQDTDTDAQHRITESESKLKTSQQEDATPSTRTEIQLQVIPPPVVAPSIIQTQPIQVRPEPSVSESAKAKQPTTNADIDKAIARGTEFKSRLQYVDKGLKRNKVQLASAWAMDGISKYVTFFTDFEAIASAAAQAKQEMRSFTTEDALKLPLTGLIYAHVEIHGRGMLPVRKVARRYVKNEAHLVIQSGEEIVQPLSKEFKSVRDASFIAPVALYTWWDTNNVSLLTGGTLGYEGSKVELEFVFLLTPEQQKRKGKVILIDADGNRHQEDVDFSQIFGQ